MRLPSGDARLAKLLLEWEERRERGEEVASETLCADDPELAIELDRRIAVLKRWEKLPLQAGWEASWESEQTSDGPTRATTSANLTVSLSDLEFLAHGGLGEVYKARHHELGRHVALKLIRKHLMRDRQSCSRFAWEARITARLEHPGIVPVYGAGVDDEGNACYAMRLVKGCTLRASIEAFHSPENSDQEPLQRSRAFRALLGRFRAACVTVAYAHNQGVLHRDLKPDNIMLGPFDETLVVDWGLAKLIQPSSSCNGRYDAPLSAGPDFAGEAALQTRGCVGTWGFMSPEQQGGPCQAVGPASDVFSLGVTLYLLLTGSLPFLAESCTETAGKVDRGQKLLPRGRKAEAPAGLEAICLKAMAQDPRERYPSAQALADDLGRWLDDEPISVRPDPWRTRARRWIVRRPVRSSIAATVLLLGALGALAGGALWRVGDVRRQEEARRQAERINDLAYANAEKDARALVQQKPVDWYSQGMEKLGEASRITSPLRSATTLRSLVAEYCGGVDLKERCQLTPVNTACLAFRSDGERLAVGEYHGIPLCQVLVFDVASQKTVASYPITAFTLDMTQTGVSSLSYSPDGRWLAAGLRNGKVLVWDTEKQGGVTVPMSLGDHAKRVVKVASSPIGTALASASRDGVVKLWDFKKSWVEAASVNIPDILQDLVFRPDGTRLECLGDRGLYALDVEKLREEPPSVHGQIQLDRSYADSRRICYGPDGQTHAASDIRFAIFLNLGHGKERRLIDRDLGMADTEEIHRLGFSPDGSLLVSGSADNTIKVWDVASSELILMRRALTEAVVYPSFSPDGRTLAVGTSNGVTLFDVLGLETMTTRAFEPDTVRAFSFAAGGDSTLERLITATGELLPHSQKHEGTIGLWGLDSVRPLRNTAISWRSDGMRQIYFLEAFPRSSLVAYGSGQMVNLFDTQKSREVGSMPAKESASLSFSPDGRMLWGLIDDLQVVSWSLPDRTLKTKWELDERISNQGRIGLACLAAGSRWVLAGSRAGLVYVLRAADGRLERVLRASGPIQCIALSPDESLVVCGLIDGRLALLRPESDERPREFPAHLDTVNAVAFDPDGGLLASASRDKTVGLWRVDGPSSLTELLRMPSRSGHPVLSVKFSPNGRILGTLAQNERAVRLWHLDRFRSLLGTLGLNWTSSADSGVAER